MKTNLTLSIEETVKVQAKAYAEEYETSVSAVVEALLEEIVKEHRRRKAKMEEDLQHGHLWTAQLRGSFPPHLSMISNNYSYKELKMQALKEKYPEYFGDDEDDSTTT